MENINQHIKKLYLNNEYIDRNPNLHEEDSLWKFNKIVPLIDKLTREMRGNNINLLDVGGGGGIILNKISSYIQKNHKRKVNKFALDLSAEILKIQKKRNPDLKIIFNEDICKTSINSKKMDLILMIDVLEHIPEPSKALKEIRRISKFAIFKVPLENNLVLNIWNLIRRNKLRQENFERLGHINIYDLDTLRHQIERYTGRILDFYFTNVFDYLLNSKFHKENKKRSKLKLIYYKIGANLFKISPKLSSALFCDFVIISVKCY